MPFEQRTVLNGTESVHRPGLEATGPAKSDETVRVSVILKRSGAARSGDGNARDTSEIAASGVPEGASPADISAVEDFAHHAGLTLSLIHI